MSKTVNTDDCWLWAGYIGKAGYGSYGSQLAHRLMYGQYHILDNNLELDHLCRVRHCVNPEHLEQVTHAENNHRTRQPTCKRGHKWSVKTEYWYVFNGLRNRKCWECIKLRTKRRKAKS